MAVNRGHIEEIAFSTDYTGDASAATWTPFPILKIMDEGRQSGAEEAQLVQTINGLDVSAGKKLVEILPIARADDDTFLNALKTAEDNLTPVWFKKTITGNPSPRIIGGPSGCQVYVNENPTPNWGSLVSALVGYSVTGPTPGSTFRISVTGT